MIFNFVIGRRHPSPGDPPPIRFSLPDGCPELDQENLISLICLARNTSYERKFKIYSGLNDKIKRYVLDNPAFFGKII